MAETEAQRKARSYIAGALSLLEGMDRPYGGITKAAELEAPMALLDLAELAFMGTAAAREKKNAGDRERRAKAMAKPRPRPKKKSKAWGAALTGGETDIG